MSRCSICQHPQRIEMEKLILKDQPVLAVAKQFGVGHDSLQRHVNRGHLCKELRDAHVKEYAKDLSALIETCLDISIGSAKEARAAKDYKSIGSIMSGPYKVAEILSRGSPGEGDKPGLDSMREDLKAMRAARQPTTEEANATAKAATTPASTPDGTTNKTASLDEVPHVEDSTSEQ